MGGSVSAPWGLLRGQQWEKAPSEPSPGDLLNPLPLYSHPQRELSQPCFCDGGTNAQRCEVGGSSFPPLIKGTAGTGTAHPGPRFLSPLQAASSRLGLPKSFDWGTPRDRETSLLKPHWSHTCLSSSDTPDTRVTYQAVPGGQIPQLNQGSSLPQCSLPEPYRAGSTLSTPREAWGAGSWSPSLHPFYHSKLRGI